MSCTTFSFIVLHPLPFRRDYHHFVPKTPSILSFHRLSTSSILLAQSGTDAQRWSVGTLGRREILPRTDVSPGCNF